MANEICEKCGSGVVCTNVILCPKCNHEHNHDGCKICKCKVCPSCMHIHGASHHGGHSEGHHHHNPVHGKE